MYRRKGTTKRDKLIRALDAITPKIIKLRDGNKCQRCGSMPHPQGRHWAHIYGRGRGFMLRWNLLNAVTLCNGCHRYLDSSPALFQAWLDEKFPALFPYLRAIYAQVYGTIRTEYLETLLKEHQQKYQELKGELE